jgi:hypothetical protein
MAKASDKINDYDEVAIDYDCDTILVETQDVNQENSQDLLEMCALYVATKGLNGQNGHTMQMQIDDCMTHVQVEEWDLSFLLEICKLVKEMEDPPYQLESVLYSLQDQYLNKVWYSY